MPTTKRMSKLSKQDIKIWKKTKYEVAEKLLALQDTTKNLSHKEKYAMQANLVRTSIITMLWLTEDMIKSQAKRINKKGKSLQLIISI